MPTDPAIPFPTCPNLGYQMHSPDGLHSDFGTFDLNTATLVDPVVIDSPVNAFGYSRYQKLFWGMYTNPNPDELVRIDSQGTAARVGPLGGLVTAGEEIDTNVGTIGLYQGREALFIQTRIPENELMVIDVDPSDGQVGDVLFRTTLDYFTPGGVTIDGTNYSILRIGDWDFNPSDGLLYTLEMEGDTIRRLVTVDPADGHVEQVMDLSSQLPDGHNYGAVYVEDFSGTVYVGNNDVNDILDNGGTDGFSQTFGIYPDLGVVIPYTPATRNQALLINDGADCLVATDFGDAPDTYRTLNPNGGPGHIFSEVGDPNTYDFDPNRKLRMGTLIDPDVDGIPSPNADGDDLNLPANDEDGVPAGTVLSATAPLLTVPITNTTGQDATLAGWIDFDGSGTFDPQERATVSLAAGDTSGTLAWTNRTEAQLRETFMRLRLYPGTVTDPQATGAEFILGGEIEDHKIQLGPDLPAPPTVTLASLPVTGINVAGLAKAGALLVLCGGLGYAVGPRRRRREG